MCAQWMESFSAFIEHMGPCPEGLTLDRRDVNGHYEPDNCRWATMVEQQNNTRQNRHVTINGAIMTVANAARLAGVAPWRVYHRLDQGWSDHHAVFEPVGWTAQQGSMAFV
mgnify:CR=1 FL=1